MHGNTKIKFRIVPSFNGNMICRHFYRGADKSLARPAWKKQLKVRRLSSDVEVIAASVSWFDGQHSEFFFWVASKSYCLVAVACFLPGRAKDLSAPRYSNDRGRVFSKTSVNL